jgi:hypothetical protein
MNRKDAKNAKEEEEEETSNINFILITPFIFIDRAGGLCLYSRDFSR